MTLTASLRGSIRTVPCCWWDTQLFTEPSCSSGNLARPTSSGPIIRIKSQRWQRPSWAAPGSCGWRRSSTSSPCSTSRRWSGPCWPPGPRRRATTCMIKSDKSDLDLWYRETRRCCSVAGILSLNLLLLTLISGSQILESVAVTSYAVFNFTLPIVFVVC